MNPVVKRNKHKPRQLVYSTPYGELFHGDSEKILNSEFFEKYKNKIELI